MHKFFNLGQVDDFERISWCNVPRLAAFDRQGISAQVSHRPAISDAEAPAALNAPIAAHNLKREATDGN